MMYKMTNNADVVIRIDDGAIVPREHRFWDDYEAWLLSGGTPMPADTVSLESIERAWRDAAILRVKWLSERHQDEILLKGKMTLSDLEFAELLTYLQALRNWPRSTGFPVMDNRPLAPAWIPKYGT